VIAVPVGYRPVPCDSYGDFDDDGVITYKDVSLLEAYLQGGWPAVQAEAEKLGIELKIDEAEFVRRADVTGDGVVDELDLWFLRDYYSGYYTVPVCPKPKPRRSVIECLLPRLHGTTPFVRIDCLRYYRKVGLASTLECLFPRIYCLLYYRGEGEEQQT